MKYPVVLSIAGLDPSGGAGIIADIKTFSAFECYGAAVVTSITFQNTVGVFGTIHQTAESIRQQTQPIIDDFTIAGIKIGMLPTREAIVETARLIKENKLTAPVVDPVVRSTSGFDLIDDEVLKSLIETLFPLSRVITPNLPEAERITKIKIQSENEIYQAAKIMQNMGAKAVLIKGGHFHNSNSAKDFLFEGDELTVFEADFIETTATHGTGCTLAAGIAANLAWGFELREAVGNSKSFVTEAIRTAPNIGHGHSPINHLVNAREGEMLN